MKLLFVIEKIKSLFPSGCKINVHSCFRCTPHNIDSGGKKNSQHLDGSALDFDVENMYWEDLYSLLLEIEEICGIGIYLYGKGKYFIHIDVERRKGRRWFKVNGEYIDFPLERN